MQSRSRKKNSLMTPIRKIGGVVRKEIGKQYIQYRSKREGHPAFQQKVPIFIDSSRYIVRTAATYEELRQALRLRYQVFIKEGLHRRKAVGLDIDRFDFVADHLLVEEKASGCIVGTYRIITSLFSNEFYSQSEFELSEFLAEPGIKLELGRACIELEHRNGAVLTMLWKGIHEYMSLTNSRFLFGCASVKSVNIPEIASITLHLLKEDKLSDQWNIRPTEAYRARGLENELARLSSMGPNELAGEKIPPLLRSYFKAGAKIMGMPALDWDFQCIDFLTILEKDLLDGSYSRKFSTR